VNRYLRLYLHFLRFSFSRAMEFRVDFFFRVVMDIVFYIVQFIFFNIIYLHTPILGGWDLDQMTVFISAFIFVDAFHMTFFANNTWWFPIAINRGDLDYYLTRPASSFFFLGFKEFAANSLLNLIMATGLLIYTLNIFPAPLEVSKVFFFILFLINGAFLYFMTYLIFLMPVFWTQSPRGFMDVFYSAEKIYQRPDGIFSGYFRRFFLFFLPFSIMASYPTRFLFENNVQNIVIQIIAASTFVYFMIFILWKKGLRDYSSASS
jgi:ABC-2 type transport system permease protein